VLSVTRAADEPLGEGAPVRGEQAPHERRIARLAARRCREHQRESAQRRRLNRRRRRLLRLLRRVPRLWRDPVEHLLRLRRLLRARAGEEQLRGCGGRQREPE